ncbi:hypothetical protein TBLA_0C07080 [Henningerozyma blattae CBS 6284]|uniref:Protein PXR1 n=1 Tax=Henningerozyma blattae (strain ATCC 34711 / CBS 6284 / DSM 70876 / NBRC 10599 / NRRL Y-10934 / UCD 77-7) TaxID=1071380 RepID=I2H297_HENB6|nr:hypothetical protein TBLA_0C07080 [Tetrapisispora blattae CBS 6284]CCH60499.1 hypothetical protein TBLA_0C07080 [Tetrapisispora blattae CBS 6284]
MGLAGTRIKQRFGLDPRNTNWSNDTSRFGHKQLEKFGWTPGDGLGTNPRVSSTAHIKVTIKDDNLGLGAKIKRKERADEFDNGECAGLDVFQRILGRLNGKEEEISNELEKQRKDKILNGKWGVHFVKGDTLSSTWDPETKKLKSYSNVKRNREEMEPEDKSTSEKSDINEDEQSSKKRRKKEKKEKKKEKKQKKESKVKKSKEEKKESKLKNKDKKKEKKVKKSKEEKEVKMSDKKSKKNEKDKKSNDSKVNVIEASKTASKVPSNVSTRLSVRSKWIKQKRAAVMDAKALNEIFMVTNN